MVSYRSVGQSSPRADGLEAVTGAGRYTADIGPPGTLWGRALRSPFPHARIVRIDTTLAKQVPGVHAVLTGADVRGVLYGRRLYDVPVLAEERVRFAGERVAAIAADDLDAADEALSLIEVEYEELPAVFDPEKAMAEDAPLLHPDVNSYKGLPKPVESPSNVFVSDAWGKGDVSVGFAEADLIIENTYTTSLQHQAYIEPHTCLVRIDDQGRLLIWISSKVPYAVRQQMADALNLPLDRILVNPVHIGGDFGGKGSPMDVPVAYFLALRTERPVLMVLSYMEELMAGNPRHASVVHLKTGVKQDGTLTALQSRVLFNSGAYGGFKPAPGVNLGGASKSAGPYRIPNVHIEALQVYTNTVPGGFMRAPGEPQAIFAIESHMDSIARQLGMDPLEYRLKNMIREGDDTPIGATFHELRGKEALESAASAAVYRSPKKPYVGRGVAIAERAPAGGETHVGITLNPDASVVVHTSIYEQGSGTYTLLQQVVAEELGLPPNRIRVEVWDTDQVSFDSGAGGSRFTRIASQTAWQAAQQVRYELLHLAAQLLGWEEDRLALRGDMVVNPLSGESRQWAALLGEAGRSVTARAASLDNSPSPVTSFTAQIAEVSVDPDTGEVKLLRFTTAHDVGRVMNPQGHQGQIDGGVIQGVGYALTEKLEVDDGRVTTLSLGDYRLPNMKDIPQLETVLLESESGVGPYNIKGIGENPNVPVAPAIANAVEDAVGVRIRDLPITSEKVYWALKSTNTSGGN